MRHVPFFAESLEPRQLMSYGQPVANFGVAGLTSVDFGNSPAELLVDGSERIVTVCDNGLARFTKAGVLDSTFGTSGKTTLAGLSVRDAAFDSSGRILVLASGQSGTLVLRFTAAGKKDKTFADNGAALVTSDTTFESKSMAIQSGGQFVIAGTVLTSDGYGHKTRAYRLTDAGQPDTTFDSDGAADVQFSVTDLLNPTSGDVVVEVASVSGNKVLLLGQTQAFSTNGSYGDSQLVAAQLTDTGALDTAFGSGGFARLTIASETSLVPGMAAKLLADGSFVLAATDSEPRILVGQFTSAGSLAREDRMPARSNVGTIRDVAQLPDGRLALVAEGTSGSYYDGPSHTLVILDGNGQFSSIIRVKDESGAPLFNPYYPSQIQAIGDDILLAGAGYNSGTQTLVKLDAGTATDRPDHLPSGSVSDLVTDSAGALHVAYYDTLGKNLVYAFRDPSGVWNAPRTIDAKPLAGMHLSIDVDSANRPAIAYYDGTNADLKLAQYNGRKWVLNTLDSKGTVGQYPSLQFSETDALAVAYYSRKGGDLKFAIGEKRKWTYETVDAAGDVGRSVSLEFTPNSKRASVAYTNTAGDLKYAVRTKPGKWTITNVAITKAGAAHLDLAYGGYNNRGAISYYDAKTADLKLAYFDGAMWKLRTLATAGTQGLYSHVYAPYESELFVFSYNATRDQFSVFRTSWDTNSTTETVLDAKYGNYLAACVAADGNVIAAAYDSTSSDLQVVDLVFR